MNHINSIQRSLIFIRRTSTNGKSNSRKVPFHSRDLIFHPTRTHTNDIHVCKRADSIDANGQWKRLTDHKSPNDESFRRHMAAVQKLPPAEIPTKNGQIPAAGARAGRGSHIRGPRQNEGVCLSSALC